MEARWRILHVERFGPQLDGVSLMRGPDREWSSVELNDQDIESDMGADAHAWIIKR